MAQSSSTAANSLKHIEWMWQSDANPWSKSEPAVWSHYSDVENLIIEEAYSNKQSKAKLDGYYIDFENNVQISNTDENKQRPVRRVVREREDKHLREARFVETPTASGQSLGGEYGWIPPFVVEVRRDLGLKKEQLPSKNKDLVPILVEKAALGIVEEGKQIQKQCEAEMLANLLRKQKDNGMKEVWKCCAYLYSLESFLYKNLNVVMRMVGNKDDEQIWRSKIRTLGPFCLLLWDDPFNKRVQTKRTLYRGADLKPEQIVIYEHMAKHPDEYCSFQSFTSCSRNRKKAEEFGNTLFIMDIEFGFMADLSKESEYPNEEEELLAPGICFCVTKIETDPKTRKQIIHLKLRPRWSGKYDNDFSIL